MTEVWDIDEIKARAFTMARLMMARCPKFMTGQEASVWMNAGLIVAKSILAKIDNDDMKKSIYALKLFEQEVEEMEKIKQ